MTVRAVADTAPLIHLSDLDSLALLDAVDRLVVPDVVIQELEAGSVPTGLDDLD